MKVLLVEDDPNKREKISLFIESDFPTVHLDSASSYNAGINKIMDTQYSLVILDMSLPIFDISPSEDGFDVDPYAGRFLLSEMIRRQINVPVIIITQFDTFGEGQEFKTLRQLDQELKADFGLLYRDSIFYSPAEENWKSKLAVHLSNL